MTATEGHYGPVTPRVEVYTFGRRRVGSVLYTFSETDADLLTRRPVHLYWVVVALDGGADVGVYSLPVVRCLPGEGL